MDTQHPETARMTHFTDFLKGRNITVLANNTAASLQSSDDLSTHNTPAPQLAAAADTSSLAPMSSKADSAVLKHDQADGETNKKGQESGNGSSPAQTLDVKDSGDKVNFYMLAD